MSPDGGSGAPAAEWTIVASSACARSSGGRMPGRRDASIVLPDPGGPMNKLWCAPAAAISRASRASGWPWTSQRSGTCSGAMSGPRGWWSGHGSPSHRVASSSRERPHGMDLTASCNVRFDQRRRGHDDVAVLDRGDDGHDTADRSHRAVETEFADERQALDPGHIDEPRDDEDPHGDREIEPGSRLAAVARRQADRDQVVGPVEARTGERRGGPDRGASRIDSSGRPTMCRPGSPLPRCTSTWTAWPRAPRSIADGTEANIAPPWMTRRELRRRNGHRGEATGPHDRRAADTDSHR